MTADGSAADAVACTGLTHAFGNTPAVDGLDLTVREGEVFGPVAADLRSDLHPPRGDPQRRHPQAITMPLFFGSNALYPVDVMPGRLADLVRDVMCGTPSASRCGLRRRIVPAHGLISDQRGRSPWPQRIPLI